MYEVYWVIQSTKISQPTALCTHNENTPRPWKAYSWFFHSDFKKQIWMGQKNLEC